MELEPSAAASVGTYLLLAFVVPGFCYLLVLAFCFPDFVSEKIRFFSGRATGPANVPGKTSNAGKDGYSTMVIVGLAIVVGLLITSVTFALEVLLRCYWPWFNKKYWPPMHLEKIASLDAAGKNTFFIQLLSGSAIMQFNIGLGIILILLVFCFCKWRRLNPCRISRVWPKLRPLTKLKAWRQTGLIVCFSLIAIANLIDSKALYRRTNAAIKAAIKSQPVAESGKPAPATSLSAPASPAPAKP